jgi:drug/metabolite transporter (DMT)-like permease
MCVAKAVTNINGLEMSFHLGLGLAVASSLAYPVFVRNQLPIEDMLWGIVYSGIPQNIVQILFVSAIVLSKNTGITNLMCFLSIAVSYFVSLFRYGERLNEICLAGVILIFFGIFKTLTSR